MEKLWEWWVLLEWNKWSAAVRWRIFMGEGHIKNNTVKLRCQFQYRKEKLYSCSHRKHALLEFTYNFSYRAHAQCHAWLCFLTTELQLCCFNWSGTSKAAQQWGSISYLYACIYKHYNIKSQHRIYTERSLLVLYSCGMKQITSLIV